MKPIYFDGVSPGASSRATTQAQRIVAAFGGAPRLAKALWAATGTWVSDAAVYRWTYPYRSGLIPAKYIAKIQEAAKKYNIELTLEDWSPVPRKEGV